MAIANYNEEKPLIIYTFKKLCNGEQSLAAQQEKEREITRESDKEKRE